MLGSLDSNIDLIEDNTEEVMEEYRLYDSSHIVNTTYYPHYYPHNNNGVINPNIPSIRLSGKITKHIKMREYIAQISCNY